MIHCAEKLLKEEVAAIGEYAASRDDACFWRDIQTLEGLSLQQLQLENDEAFFREIGAELNVITSIIAHPHIVNERETIILRAEQAHGLTPEMFRDTVRDQRLWKDKRGVMTPAEVYYFQNIDRLANYENRFIVHLIDQIGSQISDYTKFYDYLLGTLARDGALTFEGSALEQRILRLETLAKKVRRIKGTFFYKEVQKAGTAFTHVEATNVLKHNRLYNHCFRFYVRYVTYGDEQARTEDLQAYFFTRMLLALRQAGFAPSSRGKKGEGIVRPMAFSKGEFHLKLEADTKFGGLYVNVENRQNGGACTRNLLLFDGAADFGSIRKDLAEYPEGLTSIEAVNLWDLAYAEGDVFPRHTARGNETELLSRYLAEKTQLTAASKALYETRCPVCGGKEVRNQTFYTCGRCGSMWRFAESKVWLAKLRKA